MSWSFLDISRTYPGHFQEKSRKNLRHFQEMSWNFPGHCPEINCRKIPGFLPDISRIFPVMFRTYPGMFPDLFLDFSEYVPKIPRKLSRTFRGMSRKFPGRLPEISQQFTGDFLEISWKFPGSVLEMSRRHQRKFSDFPGNVLELVLSSPIQHSSNMILTSLLFRHKRIAHCCSGKALNVLQVRDVGDIFPPRALKAYQNLPMPMKSIVIQTNIYQELTNVYSHILKSMITIYQRPTKAHRKSSTCKKRCQPTKPMEASGTNTKSDKSTRPSVEEVDQNILKAVSRHH